MEHLGKGWTVRSFCVDIKINKHIRGGIRHWIFKLYKTRKSPPWLSGPIFSPNPATPHKSRTRLISNQNTQLGSPIGKRSSSSASILLMIPFSPPFFYTASRDDAHRTPPSCWKPVKQGFFGKDLFNARLGVAAGEAKPNNAKFFVGSSWSKSMNSCLKLKCIKENPSNRR